MPYKSEWVSPERFDTFGGLHVYHVYHGDTYEDGPVAGEYTLSDEDDDGYFSLDNVLVDLIDEHPRWWRKLEAAQHLQGEGRTKLIDAVSLLTAVAHDLIPSGDTDMSTVKSLQRCPGCGSDLVPWHHPVWEPGPTDSPATIDPRAGHRRVFDRCLVCTNEDSWEAFIRLHRLMLPPTGWRQTPDGLWVPELDSPTELDMIGSPSASAPDHMRYMCETDKEDGDSVAHFGYSINGEVLRTSGLTVDQLEERIIKRWLQLRGEQE